MPGGADGADAGRCRRRRPRGSAPAARWPRPAARAGNRSRPAARGAATRSAPTSASSGVRASIRSVRYGWVLARSRWEMLHWPGSSQTPLGMPIMPMSCTSAARRSMPTSAAGSPSVAPAWAASSATPREWPRRSGDFRSLKSAKAVSARSSWSSLSAAPSRGSRPITSSHAEMPPSPSRISACRAQKQSTRAGSNCVPRRSRATRSAASAPPAWWNASTTSARWTRRIAGARSSAPASPGTPRPSHRSKACSSGSHTAGPSSSHPARSLASWQCAVITCCTDRPAVARNFPTSPTRWKPDLPRPR